MYIYIHTYTHIFMYTYTYIYIYIYMSLSLSLSLYIYIYICIYIQLYMGTRRVTEVYRGAFEVPSEALSYLTCCYNCYRRPLPLEYGFATF